MQGREQQPTVSRRKFMISAFALASTMALAACAPSISRVSIEPKPDPKSKKENPQGEPTHVTPEASALEKRGYVDATEFNTVDEVGNMLRQRYESEGRSEGPLTDRPLEVIVPASVVEGFGEKGLEYKDYIGKHANILNGMMVGHGLPNRISLENVVVVNDNVAAEINQDSGYDLYVASGEPANLHRIYERPGYMPNEGNSLGSFTDNGQLDIIAQIALYYPTRYLDDRTPYNTTVNSLDTDGNPIPAEKFYRSCNDSELGCTGAKSLRMLSFGAEWIRQTNKHGFSGMEGYYLAREWLMNVAYEGEITQGIDLGMVAPPGSEARMFIAKHDSYNEGAYDQNVVFEEQPDATLHVDAAGNLVLPKELVSGYSYKMKRTDGGWGTHTFSFGKNIVIETTDSIYGTKKYLNLNSQDILYGYWKQSNNDHYTGVLNTA